MNDLLVRKIRECPSLPSLPAIALQIIELAQKEEVDLNEIARVICKDPALSSKILRTVNSSFYGRSQSIGTISHALVILGLQSVKTLVLGFSLVNHLKNHAKGFKHINYWRRSIYAATAARTVAQKLNLVQQEECFLSGLLGDIGMLVLNQAIGKQYGELHEHVSTHEQLVEAERRALDMTHADVTRMMAEQWKLPPVLVMPMAYHHSPASVTDTLLRRLTDVVHLAGRCADVFVDASAAESIAAVRRFCQENYCISEADCDGMLNEICRYTKEVAPLFEVTLGPGTTYESILKRANETLVDLTLRTQQQAASLEQLNLKLKKQATTDGLTGLANRAYFDEFLAEQFSRAESTGRPLSMLLIDVDHFKKINDEYGHPIGDEVLRVLGERLCKSVRVGDLAARYGGEELAVVMPNATRVTAAAVAEEVRRRIGGKAV
ncbi:MAG: HDOD domain-containing protein, partial [Bacillota bacterium]